MTSLDLARSYLKKAEARVDILEVLYRKAAYSDVVREAQEDIDFIPTEEYTSENAQDAISGVELSVCRGKSRLVL